MPALVVPGGLLAGGTSMQTEELGQSHETVTRPVESVTEGSACRDDPKALCLPLG